MRFDYRIVNVFTRAGDRLTGNPLCVFEDARGLDEAQMQALALQFNLSETTFILPSDEADAQVRIFTPDYEMPFAGHPTLGTAHVLRSSRKLGDSVTLEMKAGTIPVRAQGDYWELGARAAKTRTPRATAPGLAAAFGLEASDMSGPALWVDAGSEQLIVPLASPEAVKRASVSCESLLQTTADGLRAQAYLFAATGPSTLLARFFFTKAGSVLEDPATGSATANLGGWYLAQQATLPLSRSISQGEQTGRPSTLQLRIDPEGRVFVAGDVIELGRGYVEL
jgi:trans-2,3-dihydro-3-hydroxyanthranilate isomerase